MTTAMPITLKIEHIPTDITQSDHCVGYEVRRREGEAKPTKVPINVTTGELASTTNPATWSTFDTVLAALKAGKVDGVGFVFTAEDDYVGIDLDHCIDPDTGDFTNEAIAIVNAINSYTEISPSGTGLHIIAKGTLPAGRRRKGGIEAYSEARYFTVTGNGLPGSPATIEDRGAELAEFHHLFLADPDPPRTGPVPRGSGSLADQELIQHTRAAKNGAKFSKLFDGDYSDYESQSEADLALVSLIAFWTDDVDQIDSIFRMSGLIRAKWLDREDYRDATIATALAGRTEFYDPTRQLAPPPIAGGAPLPEPPDKLWEGDPQTTAGRPVILVSHRQLRELTAEATAALVAANAPAHLFTRGEALVRVQRDEADHPTIRVLGLDQMIAELTDAADFYREIKSGERRDAPPPKDLAANILAQSQWPFPPLRSIVEQPIFRPNGTVVDQPGYDPATRVFYAPAPDLIVPPIPDQPSPTEIQAARALIEDELLGDFPFDSDASRAHAIAMLLTPAVREAIKGAIPIAIVDKPEAGAGASLLADCVAHIVTGRPAGMMTAPQREEEWGKSLLAIAETGSPQITIDNVDRVIRSSALSSAVTASRVYGRRLGSSTIVQVPWRAQIVITGNNISFAGDIGRRVYVCRIDPKMARPWRREGFRHPSLLTWTQAERGPILGAILTLGRAWYAAGQPSATAVPRLGGFEEWAQLIGGVLEYVGISGFLGNLEQVLALVDEEAIEWEVFIRALGDYFDDRQFKTNEVVAVLQDETSALHDAVPSEFNLDAKTGSLSKRLGKAFAKRRQMRFGDDEIYLDLASDDDHANVRRWRVCEVLRVSLSAPARETGDLYGESAQTNPPNPANPQGEMWETNSPNSLPAHISTPPPDTPGATIGLPLETPS